MTKAQAKAAEKFDFEEGGLTPELLAVSASDLTFIQGHTRGVIKALKPRLSAVGQAYRAQAPVCTANPVVSGTGTVGQTLSCTSGTWLFTPTYAYQWRRAGQNIAGANAATYVLVAADSGKNIDCAVIASNGAGSTTQYSSNFISVA